jgi:N-acetylglucosaminyldiphosphoundecaprenol N-acetyl-beta-D-mannosaminyltransferase
MNSKSTTSIQPVVRSILGVNISVSSYDQTIANALRWAAERQSRAIFFANVHVVMEAFDDPLFAQCLNEADMVNADGMPLVWALRLLGEGSAQRVYGPDSTLAMLVAAERTGVLVGFYGSSPLVLKSLIRRAQLRHPNLKVVFHESPPFRELTYDEDAAAVDRINRAEVELLFVGLGCPKQEKWIASHVGRIPAVMLGVGAAFDFLGGSKPQAPRWMMRSGLEWLFRLVCEPRRLAVRYLRHNPRFIGLFAMQFLYDQKRQEPAR